MNLAKKIVKDCTRSVFHIMFLCPLVSGCSKDESPKGTDSKSPTQEQEKSPDNSNTQGNGENQTKEPKVETPGPEKSSGETQSKLDFERLATEIFRPSCTSCHNPNNPKGGVVLEKKEDFFSPEAKAQNFIVCGDASSSYIYEVIVTGYMPMMTPSIDASKIDLLKTWINSGCQ